MSLWKRLLGVVDRTGESARERSTPTGATPAPAPTTDPTDRERLARGLDLLSGHGLPPRREVTLEEIGRTPTGGMAGFRRHPLTTLILLHDEAGVPLCGRVFVDEDERSRTTADELCGFITDAAEGAGTGESVGDVVVMMDPGSDSSGSLRLTAHGQVHDLAFNLDPDFGDEPVESDILELVGPAGCTAHTLLAGPRRKPVTIWLASTDDGSLVAALEEENSR